MRSRFGRHTLGLSLLAAAGCTSMTAGMTADVFHAAAPAFEQHWDYDLARAAAPGSIMQLEGLLRIRPDDERLLEPATRAYVGYAYGFIEDEMEVAELNGEIEEQEALALRASRLYLRGRDLGKAWIANSADGFDEAMSQGHPAFVAWLESEFTSADDAGALFWTGFAWGSAINVQRGDIGLIGDLPYARALVERAVALDESFHFGAGHTFLGAADANLPQALGGNPEAGRVHFERALEVNGREFHLTQLNYAQSYAVMTQNRELFVELLREIIAAGDVPEARLSNKIARRRASRYLAQVDDLIPE